MLRKCHFLILMLCVAVFAKAQPLSGEKEKFTRADTLRGSITPERAWWDVVFYDLWIKPDLKAETLEGRNTIVFKTSKTGQVMQVDLQRPMNITRVLYRKKMVRFTRDSNAFFIRLPRAIAAGKLDSITIFYSGKPIKAKRAPWDGGVVWTKDKQKRPWVNTACQGHGASIWWPTKDHQSDEPDSMRFTVNVPDTLMNISNGRLRSVRKNGLGRMDYEWFISNPINNYNIAMNIGKYVHFADTLMGENGRLTLDYYVLDYNLEKAKKQFEQVKPMLRCFEYWFGPYPFYEDGYKLIESEHLGMEHQSAVAYGNQYKNGYLGRDLSGSGWGGKWDFIIIHESGHEWFGNNISTNDVADMWVHESFTNYSETLFVECVYGKEAAHAYNRGIRKNVSNDIPIIGTYDVNREGSGDMYYKGGNLVHTIRQTIDDDEKFRRIMRGLNKTFWHKTINTSDIENYISRESGIDFSKVFNQYLRDSRLPELSYIPRYINGKLALSLKWSNCISGFDLPVKIRTSADRWEKVSINDRDYIELQTSFDESQKDIEKLVDPNVFVKLKMESKK
jgi:aminopeptidase N